MQMLNTAYAIRTNGRYKRTGHLVRNRFYSRQVESEAHLFELCRYVVPNPVRAGLCRSPADWPWSSYRATAGHESRLKTGDSRLPDHARRLDEIDVSQSRGTPEQRVHRDLDSRREHAADVLRLRGDDVEVRRRAEVDDDARRAVAVRRGNRV